MDSLATLSRSFLWRALQPEGFSALSERRPPLKDSLYFSSFFFAGESAPFPADSAYLEQRKAQLFKMAQINFGSSVTVI